MAKIKRGRYSGAQTRKGRRVQRRQTRQPELPLGVMAVLQQNAEMAVGFRPFELSTQERVRRDVAAIVAGRPLDLAFGS